MDPLNLGQRYGLLMKQRGPHDIHLIYGKASIEFIPFPLNPGHQLQLSFQNALDYKRAYNFDVH